MTLFCVDQDIRVYIMQHTSTIHAWEISFLTRAIVFDTQVMGWLGCILLNITMRYDECPEAANKQSVGQEVTIEFYQVVLVSVLG